MEEQKEPAPAPVPPPKKRRRKWPWILLGVMVLVCGGPCVVGLIVAQSLPDEYTATVERTINAPPDRVWAELSDHQKHPVSGSEMESVKDLPDENGLPVWEEDMGEDKITVRVVEREDSKRLVLEMTAAVLPMTGRMEFTLEPEGEGTKVTLKHDVTLGEGTWHVPLFKMVMAWGDGAKMGAQAFLDGLAAGAEADAGSE